MSLSGVCRPRLEGRRTCPLRSNVTRLESRGRGVCAHCDPNRVPHVTPALERRDMGYRAAQRQPLSLPALPRGALSGSHLRADRNPRWWRTSSRAEGSPPAHSGARAAAGQDAQEVVKKFRGCAKGPDGDAVQPRHAPIALASVSLNVSNSSFFMTLASPDCLVVRSSNGSLPPR